MKKKSIKIETTEGYQSFKELQNSLKEVANAFGNMEDEIEVERLQSWIQAAKIRMESFDSLIQLSKSYIAGVQLEQFLIEKDFDL